MVRRYPETVQTVPGRRRHQVCLWPDAENVRHGLAHRSYRLMWSIVPLGGTLEPVARRLHPRKGRSTSLGLDHAESMRSCKWMRKDASSESLSRLVPRRSSRRVSVAHMDQWMPHSDQAPKATANRA